MHDDAVVFIVDDDPGVRDSLRFVMESAHLAARAYASAAEFLEDYDHKQPGCLVLDLKMPGMSGFELVQEFRSQQIQLPIIVVTGHGDVPTAVESMKLGVLDFLQKPVENRVLLAKVRNGLQRDAEQRQQQAETKAIRERMASLTPRQRKLVELLVAGKPSKQIALELGISVKTVANHRAHVMRKTQAANVADLARMAMIVRPSAR
jgi:two-component system response regulator FixJ